MIDFNNKSVIKLSPAKIDEESKTLKELLINDETVLEAFSSVRDKLIFTNKRIIAINVQGITGSKKDYTSIPYSKIQTFSVETAGTFDLDSELDIFISGVGKIRFELSKGANIKHVSNIIATYILK